MNLYLLCQNLRLTGSARVWLAERHQELRIAPLALLQVTPNEPVIARVTVRAAYRPNQEKKQW
jgi:hypothetical protein